MFSERVANLKGSIIREILVTAQQPGMISFAGGLPSTECLPELDFTGIPKMLSQYGSSEGETDLREWIAKNARENLGIDCTYEQVLIVAGSQQALDLMTKLYVDNGSPVLTEGPTFLAALQIIKFFGARVVEVEQDAAGLSAEKLKQAILENHPRFAYLIPSYQNPSGVCYTEENRKEIAAVLSETKTPIYEDDPYRDLCFDGETPKPIVTHLDKDTPFVYAGSFSKILSPGLRVGYLISSPELFPYLLKIKQANDLHVNRAAQWFVHKEVSKPTFPAHLKNLQSSYREKRNSMQNVLEQYFSDLATWTQPSGGLFFWLKLKKQIDTLALLKEAIARQVAFVPGEPFFDDGEAHKGYIRLNFSNAEIGNIEKGLKILAELIKEKFAEN